MGLRAIYVNLLRTNKQLVRHAPSFIRRKQSAIYQKNLQMAAELLHIVLTAGVKSNIFGTAKRNIFSRCPG